MIRMTILRMDFHQSRRVSEHTLIIYRRALEPFLKWLRKQGLDPKESAEMDEALIEYKNSEDGRHILTRAKFGHLVSAITFVLPPFRGHLPWSASVATGWEKHVPPVHTMPMPKWVARLYMVQLGLMGHPEMGLMLGVQQAKGLRPSEACGIKPEDVMFDPDGGIEGSALKGTTVIRLGKTKRGRPEVAFFKEGENPELVKRLRRLKEHSAPGVPMAGMSTQTLRKTMDHITRRLGIPFRMLPHSPRAGFATDAVAAGVSVNDIRLTGRWADERSFKIYLDIIAAMAVDLDSVSGHLKDVSRRVELNFDQYFPYYK